MSNSVIAHGYLWSAVQFTHYHTSSICRTGEEQHQRVKLIVPFWSNLSSGALRRQELSPTVWEGWQRHGVSKWLLNCVVEPGKVSEWLAILLTWGQSPPTPLQPRPLMRWDPLVKTSDHRKFTQLISMQKKKHPVSILETVEDLDIKRSGAKLAPSWSCTVWNLQKS